MGRVGWVWVFLLGVLCGGCRPDGAEKPSDPPGASELTVAASIFPLYDLVRSVAGDAARVELLLPPGKGAHSYQPSVKEVRKLGKAKVAFLVGLELDDWAAKVFEASSTKTKIVRLGPRADVAEFRELRHGHGEKKDPHDDDKEESHHDDHDEHEREEGHDGHGKPPSLDHHHPKGPDPHVWLSVPNAIKLVDAIANELSAAQPSSKAAFDENAATLKKSLGALHTDLKKGVAGLPKKRIVTFHGSFGYFAKEYGVDIVAVIEPSPGKEPSAAYLKEVLEVLEHESAGALFTEPQLDKRPAEVVAKEAELPLGELDPIGGVEGRESYDALMRSNLKALEGALR